MPSLLGKSVTVTHTVYPIDQAPPGKVTEVQHLGRANRIRDRRENGLSFDARLSASARVAPQVFRYTKDSGNAGNLHPCRF